MSEIMQNELVFEGKLFNVERRRWRGADGRQVVRDIVRHPGAVLIVPRIDHRVVLIRNRRIAVDRDLLELPAGTAEPEEAPEVTALRELREETGYRAARIARLGAFYTSPGFSDELIHVFVADDLTPGKPETEPWEDITVEIVDWRDALDMTLDGRIHDGKTVAALWMAEAGLGTEQ